MRLMLKSFSTFFCLTFGLSGCLSQRDETSEVEKSAYAIEIEKVSVNALSIANLVLNQAAVQKLGVLSLVSGTDASGRFLLDVDATSGMDKTSDGREVLLYVIRCALSDDETVAFVNAGVEYEMEGNLGLAPAWKDRALTETERRKVSSCLLAHGNAFGVSVPFSARMNGVLSVTSEELARYVQEEGAFFGDVFDDDQPMFACFGNTPPSFTVSYPNHDLGVGDRLLRRCTDIDPSKPSQTVCGLTYVGACSLACATHDQNGYRDCYGSAGIQSTMYAEVMSTWLLAHDDQESVWPLLYDQIYGP